MHDLGLNAQQRGVEGRRLGASFFLESKREKTRGLQRGRWNGQDGVGGPGSPGAWSAAASPVLGLPPAHRPARAPRAGSRSPSDTSWPHRHDRRPGRSPDDRVRAETPSQLHLPPRRGEGRSRQPSPVSWVREGGAEVPRVEWQDQGCRRPRPQPLPGPASALGTPAKAADAKAADTRPNFQTGRGKERFQFGSSSRLL